MEQGKEKNETVSSISALEYFYFNRVLNDFLSTLTNEELKDAYNNLLDIGIAGDRAEILEEVKKEMEFRSWATYEESQEESKKR